MSRASGPPVSAAAALFRGLGYTVPEASPEFEAHRKWRTVEVTVLGDDPTPPTPALADGGRSTEDPGLHCYVAPRAAADSLCDRLESLDPACDWAVVAIDGPDDYDVLTAP
ncbi:MAG: hypothetical protein ABEJ43_02290 [Haloferacaceae archaeon]